MAKARQANVRQIIFPVQHCFKSTKNPYHKPLAALINTATKLNMVTITAIRASAREGSAVPNL